MLALNKILKSVLNISLLTLLSLNSFAQTTSESPVKWHITASKEQNVSKLNVEATIKDGFHIWAMDAGGDGSLIATTIVLNENDTPLNWVSDQKPHAEQYEFVEGSVFYYDKKVKFSTPIKNLKSKEIKGTITFQTCNEQMCFPPEDYEFNIKL